MSAAKRCRTCGAQCCKYFCFEIDKPDGYEELDDVRWYLCHEGVSVHIQHGDWYISIANQCKMLNEDNTCKIYADRPLICRKYDPITCDFTEAERGYDYDEEFLTPEDLDQYIRQTLGQATYQQAKARARAKAAQRAKEHERA